jgi:hypothetical protein
VLASPFKSKSRLAAENAVLRHQLIVLRRKVRGRAQLTNDDRWFFLQMYRWFPSILKVVTIVQPDTLVRWHRVGFRRYWRWKLSSRGGRPQIEIELRALIRQMSTENQLWGAPRIHGEGPERLSAIPAPLVSSGTGPFPLLRFLPAAQEVIRSPGATRSGFRRPSLCRRTLKFKSGSD